MTDAKMNMEKYKEQIVFAVEQHLNQLGVLKYEGPMIDIGAIEVGLRVHIQDAPDLFDEISDLEKQAADVLGSEQSAEFEAEATGEVDDADKTD
jgi:hypothetical protein